MVDLQDDLGVGGFAAQAEPVHEVMPRVSLPFSSTETKWSSLAVMMSGVERAGHGQAVGGEQQVLVEFLAQEAQRVLVDVVEEFGLGCAHAEEALDLLAVEGIGHGGFPGQHAHLGPAFEDHVRRFRVGIDVEFGRDVRVALGVNGAAHDGQLGELARQLGVERDGRGQVGQRADGDQAELAGFWSARSISASAACLSSALRLEAGMPASPSPSAPWMLAASYLGQTSGRGQPG